MLHSWTCLKDSLKLCTTHQWILINKVHECFDVVSDFILQQTFKQLPLVKFWYSIKKIATIF